MLVQPGHRDAVQLDAAAVRLVHAGNEMHQGGLAGAVFADERMHLAAADLERDAVDGPHAREGLGDVADGQARRADGARSPGPVVAAMLSALMADPLLKARR